METLNDGSFALAVQRLPVNQRIIVLAEIVGLRNIDTWLSNQQLLQMFEALRIPAPTNLNRDLSRLRDGGIIIYQTSSRRWSLTPEGHKRAQAAIGDFNYGLIEAELIGAPGVEYAQVRHSVIPPSLAPSKWQSGLKRHLEKFPFETNVFCMTRFPKVEGQELPDPLQACIEQIRNVVQAHGLTLHLASDRQIEDDLFGNVVAHMWACKYGIGLLETLVPDQQDLNDNVLIELGSMLVMGRRCGILRDRMAPRPPSDLSGQIYKSVDFNDLESVSHQVHSWISDDLGLGRCPTCPPVSNIPAKLNRD